MQSCRRAGRADFELVMPAAPFFSKQRVVSPPGNEAWPSGTELRSAGCKLWPRVVCNFGSTWDKAPASPALWSPGLGVKPDRWSEVRGGLMILEVKCGA